MNTTDSQLDVRADKELIHSAEQVRYAFLLRYPPYLQVSAEGYTSTAGWSDAELRARRPEGSLSAGILELDFVALPPADISVQGLTRIRAEIVWEQDVYEIRGVKVYAGTNDVTKIFAEGAADTSHGGSSTGNEQ